MMDTQKSLILSYKIIQYTWQKNLILILYNDYLVDIYTLCMYYTVNHSSKYVTTFLMY